MDDTRRRMLEDWDAIERDRNVIRLRAKGREDESWDEVEDKRQRLRDRFEQLKGFSDEAWTNSEEELRRGLEEVKYHYRELKQRYS